MKRIDNKLFRTAFLVIFSFCLFGLALPIQAFQNEPDGFRGVAWGTPIHAVAGKIEKKDGAVGQFSSVKFKDEELTLGGAELLSVDYIFRDGWLFSVLIRAEKLENFNALKKYLVGKHGLVNQPDEKAESYHWKGDISSIMLSYQSQNEQVYFQMTSSKGVKDFAGDMKREGFGR